MIGAIGAGLLLWAGGLGPPTVGWRPVAADAPLFGQPPGRLERGSWDPRGPSGPGPGGAWPRAGAVGQVAGAAVGRSAPRGRAPTAGQAGELRVALLSVAPPAMAVLQAEGPWRAVAGGRTLALAPGTALELQASGSLVVGRIAGREVLHGPVLACKGPAPWRLSAPARPRRRYAGRWEFRARAGRLQPTLALGLEPYVAMVTGAEMPDDWPLAALEAQAIAARSCAIAGGRRHPSEGADVCDSTHCQLFWGLLPHHDRATAASEATRGRAIAWANQVVEAPWHATCGGCGAPNEAIFGGRPRPYLRGGPDAPVGGGAAYCHDSPHFAPWHVHATRPVLQRALAGAGWLAPGELLRHLVVIDRLPGGYATGVRVTGDRTRSVGGYALWMALGARLGWGAFCSPAFAVAEQRGGFTFTGRGLGHGVGMCQWGARGRAIAGASAASILAAYYPHTRLVRGASSSSSSSSGASRAHGP